MKRRSAKARRWEGLALAPKIRLLHFLGWTETLNHSTLIARVPRVFNQPGLAKRTKTQLAPGPHRPVPKEPLTVDPGVGLLQLSAQVWHRLSERHSPWPAVGERGAQRLAPSAELAGLLAAAQGDAGAGACSFCSRFVF